MDCKFASPEGRFNYRVAGVFVRDGRLLAMKEDRIAHWYLPGGRVRLHETMEQALCREMQEELGVQARAVRPLWLCESFFSLSGEPIHELAMYFLAELDWEKLPSLTEEFRLKDTDGDEHIFAWLTGEQVRNEPIYPLVMQKTWPQLPESLILVTDERDRVGPIAGGTVETTYEIQVTLGQPVPGADYFHRPGAYLVAVEDGLLAVAETPKGWFLPGGGIDPGESNEACIRRECQEELGREAEAGVYLGCAEAYLCHPEIPYFHPVYYFYQGRLGPKAGEPTEPDHALRLVPVEQAAEKLYLEAQRWAVGRWMAEGPQGAGGAPSLPAEKTP